MLCIVLKYLCCIHIHMRTYICTWHIPTYTVGIHTVPKPTYLPYIHENGESLVALAI